MNNRLAFLSVVVAVFCVTAIAPNRLAQAQENTPETPLRAINEIDESRVVSKSILPTGNLIKPAGKSVEFYGRPNDLALTSDRKWLLVKDWKALRVFDAASMELKQTVASPGNASLHGIDVTSRGEVLFTNAKREVHVFKNSANDADAPKFELDRSIQLPSDCFPCGVTSAADGKMAYVCLSKKNSLAVIDLEANEVTKEIPVGIAPFDVEIGTDQLLYVSNLGGRLPIDGDKTAPSAGSDVVVDKRGVASTGTVSIVSLETLEVTKSVDTGRHPSILLPLEKSVLVCNTNEDSVSQITDEGPVKAINVKPDSRLPFGSMPNGLASTEDGQTVFVALAGNNAISVLDRKTLDTQPASGLIPTGWYPVSVVCDESNLYVANIKGIGSRSERRPPEKGRNSHDHRGSVQKIAISDIRDKATLETWSKTVAENAHFPQILRTQSIAESSDVAPVPVPKKLGQPSVFKHVVYVIKENRTFDQVFGDIPEARSEPGLCIFPEKVTPNHHALAKRFGLLDNYYCNGVLSADGHSWATEGNVTPYLERAFGGFARSYTFGNDPITYSASGFIWDRFLDAGLSFRNFGEMNYSTPPEGMKYQEVFAEFEAGKDTKFAQNIGVERLRGYSSPDYPGWNMLIPDVVRMNRFLKEFREFEAKGTLPNLTLIYLPQDHLGGGVTSNAHMADNDLALGQLVEAISNSKFWDDTLIVVNEDDPQNGYDHIDGHRSLCLVISAYSQPGINHSFYNQTSVLRTALHLFGLPPLNQKDAAMPLMEDCFAATKVNAKPYKAIAANYPLNETPKPKSEQSNTEKKWRSILATVPIQRTGMKTETDEDNLNRFVWHEVKGWETPYPTDFSGAHGKGLSSLGLVIDEDADED
ncbi:bifunctional YncE family protein/alkaline phosphatase family protein [Mariniblastus fucicola]|uniref:Phosphoesterase family protein n=1 Tax=Mariniblastus fucicola TaxID=980251 RepID=A0A5B9PFF4_9BACT|nr:bifunctional YncE family protein/alkaline phosphatase family protein [Mariniblastus fucicola]QEG25004.1 Phosphoesterase family protein [Mariniblastus fucicola]